MKMVDWWEYPMVALWETTMAAHSASRKVEWMALDLVALKVAWRGTKKAEMLVK